MNGNAKKSLHASWADSCLEEGAENIEANQFCVWSGLHFNQARVKFPLKMAL
jgi:hypothetical protein